MECECDTDYIDGVLCCLSGMMGRQDGHVGPGRCALENHNLQSTLVDLKCLHRKYHIFIINTGVAVPSGDWTGLDKNKSYYEPSP